MATYRHERAQYQVVSTGVANDPQAWYVVTSRAVPLFYAAVTVKPATAIDFKRERVNLTPSEVATIQEWDLAVDWLDRVVIDPTQTGWQSDHAQREQLELNLRQQRRESEDENGFEEE